MACNEDKQITIDPQYYPRDSHLAYSQSMVKLGIGDTQLYRNWIEAHDRAMSKPVRIKAPFQETFYFDDVNTDAYACLLYTSPSPRDKRQSRMPSSA